MSSSVLQQQALQLIATCKGRAGMQPHSLQATFPIFVCVLYAFFLLSW
jgi:hypothetical protein